MRAGSIEDVYGTYSRFQCYNASVQRPTNEELGLDENGFPPTDETGDVDLSLIDQCLSLTPGQRIEKNYQARLFVQKLRNAGRRLHGSAYPDPETFE